MVNSATAGTPPGPAAEDGSSNLAGPADTDLADYGPGYVQVRDRASFHLTYRRDTTRELWPDTITGDRIDSARPGRPYATGDWTTGDWPGRDAPFPDWVRHFFAQAVAEAVHEALEWFQVDGRPLLDPHGPAEVDIHTLVNRTIAPALWEFVDGDERFVAAPEPGAQ